MLGFRVWDTENIKFIEGFEFAINKVGVLWCSDEDEEDCGTYEADTKRFIPMQSTGFIDINGKQIFEKDIFLIDYHREASPWVVGEVGMFIFQMGAMLINDAKKGWDLMKYINALPIEVIGNTFEHPELLERIK